MDDAPVIVGTWASREVTVGGEPLNSSESLAVARSGESVRWDEATCRSSQDGYPLRSSARTTWSGKYAKSERIFRQGCWPPSGNGHG